MQYFFHRFFINASDRDFFPPKTKSSGSRFLQCLCNGSYKISKIGISRTPLIDFGILFKCGRLFINSAALHMCMNLRLKLISFTCKAVSSPLHIPVHRRTIAHMPKFAVSAFFIIFAISSLSVAEEILFLAEFSCIFIDGIKLFKLMPCNIAWLSQTVF